MTRYSPTNSSTHTWSQVPERRPATPPPLGPLLAGARARGVADGLAWLGLAAVLIDDRGEALHISSGAQALMGDSLYMENGRLRARELGADRALGEAIHAALADGHSGHLRLPTADGDELWLHIAPMAVDADDPYQLLRVVALLSRARDGRPARH
jgi:hypothetical protein